MLVTRSAAWHCVAHQIPPWTNICHRLTLWGLKKMKEMQEIQVEIQEEC